VEQAEDLEDQILGLTKTEIHSLLVKNTTEMLNNTRTRFGVRMKEPISCKLTLVGVDSVRRLKDGSLINLMMLNTYLIKLVSKFTRLGSLPLNTITILLAQAYEVVVELLQEVGVQKVFTTIRETNQVVLLKSKRI
jgi:hypothetical protein